MDSDFRRPNPVNNVPPNPAPIRPRPSFNSSRPISSRPTFSDIARPVRPMYSRPSTSQRPPYSAPATLPQQPLPQPPVNQQPTRPSQPDPHPGVLQQPRPQVQQLAVAAQPRPLPPEPKMPGQQRPFAQSINGQTQPIVSAQPVKPSLSREFVRPDRPAPFQPTQAQQTQPQPTHSPVSQPPITRVEKSFALPVKKSKFRHENELIKPVKIFAYFMILAPLASIATWVLFKRTTGVNSLSYALDIFLVGALLVLAVLLLKKFNFVRSVYMGFSIALLIFSIFTTANYFITIHNLGIAGKQEIAHFSSQISQYQAMKNISAQEKQTITVALENYQKRVDINLAEDKTSLLPVVEDYVLALVPVVFLSRKKIKEVMLPVKDEVRQAGFNAAEAAGHAAGAAAIHSMAYAPAYVDPQA